MLTTFLRVAAVALLCAACAAGMDPAEDRARGAKRQRSMSAQSLSEYTPRRSTAKWVELSAGDAIEPPETPQSSAISAQQHWIGGDVHMSGTEDSVGGGSHMLSDIASGTHEKFADSLQSAPSTRSTWTSPPSALLPGGIAQLMRRASSSQDAISPDGVEQLFSQCSLQPLQEREEPELVDLPSPPPSPPRSSLPRSGSMRLAGENRRHRLLVSHQNFVAGRLPHGGPSAPIAVPQASSEDEPMQWTHLGASPQSFPGRRYNPVADNMVHFDPPTRARVPLRTSPHFSEPVSAIWGNGRGPPEWLVQSYAAEAAPQSPDEPKIYASPLRVGETVTIAYHTARLARCRGRDTLLRLIALEATPNGGAVTRVLAEWHLAAFARYLVTTGLFESPGVYRVFGVAEDKVNGCFEVDAGSHGSGYELHVAGL